MIGRISRQRQQLKECLYPRFNLKHAIQVKNAVCLVLLTLNLKHLTLELRSSWYSVTNSHLLRLIPTRQAQHNEIGCDATVATACSGAANCNDTRKGCTEELRILT